MSATGLDVNGDLLPFHVDNRDPEQVAMEYLAARRAGKSIEEAITVPLPHVVMTGDREIKTVPYVEVPLAELEKEQCCGPDGGCACDEELKPGHTLDDGSVLMGTNDDGTRIWSEPVNQPGTDGVFDVVNHPPHYNFGTIEVIDVLEDWNVSYMIGNVIKYVARAPHKGNEIQDLKKAQFYLNREIERLEREAGS